MGCGDKSAGRTVWVFRMEGCLHWKGARWLLCVRVLLISSRRIIEEHIGLSIVGTVLAHTLLFMLHYWLASRYIGLYIAHESDERRHALIANPAMTISAHQVSRATCAMKKAIWKY